MAAAFDYSNIAANWKELSGLNNWEGLVTPLDVDVDLRRYILHYGDMALAASEAYIGDELSAHYGQCRYSKKGLLDGVGLIKGRHDISKYDVTKLLYISSKGILGLAKGTVFGGYVAVASDAAKVVLGRRDILVAWRGTAAFSEHLENINFNLVEDQKLFPTQENIVPKMHAGFLEMYTLALQDNELGKVSARDQVVNEIQRLVEEYKGEEMSITIAGFSMGTALGTLLAADIVTNGYNKPKGTNSAIPVTAILSGTPRVGDEGFARYVSDKTGLHILRVVNVSDAVPNLPLEEWGYKHVGKELLVDSFKSPYLLKVDDPLKRKYFAHYDQAYFHAVAGSHGKDGPFQLEVNRDLAQLNKSANYLVDAEEKRIPGQWWIPDRKGMVLMEDGTWVLDGDVPKGP